MTRSKSTTRIAGCATLVAVAAALVWLSFSVSYDFFYTTAPLFRVSQDGVYCSIRWKPRYSWVKERGERFSVSWREQFSRKDRTTVTVTTPDGSTVYSSDGTVRSQSIGRRGRGRAPGNGYQFTESAPWLFRPAHTAKEIGAFIGIARSAVVAASEAGQFLPPTWWQAEPGKIARLDGEHPLNGDTIAYEGRYAVADGGTLEIRIDRSDYRRFTAQWSQPGSSRGSGWKHFLCSGYRDRYVYDRSRVTFEFKRGAANKVMGVSVHDTRNKPTVDYYATKLD